MSANWRALGTSKQKKAKKVKATAKTKKKKQTEGINRELYPWKKITSSQLTWEDVESRVAPGQLFQPMHFSTLDGKMIITHVVKFWCTTGKEQLVGAIHRRQIQP